MDTSKLHPTVKSAIEAMNNRERQAWFDQFASGAELSDDGHVIDLTEWSDGELFGTFKSYLATVDRVEDDGRSVYGKFHSDQWGDFDTYMRFHLDGDGKITRLDVGQMNATN
jgi:hypothetical protein